MKLIAKKSSLKGITMMPGSKSHTIRAIAVAGLATGLSKIHSPLVSQDTLSAVECYRAFGARIDTSRDSCWQVQGTGGEIIGHEQAIDVGNSGTTLRLGMAAAALCKQAGAIIITGDEQVKTRPIGPLIKSLNDLGAKVFSVNNNDKAPVSISGILKGGKTAIQCITSQYLSSLLLACPLAGGDTEIAVTLLNEPDYVRMTLDWLDRQKIKYQNEKMRFFRINGNQKYKPFDETIPADFSSATFFLCAAAVLGGPVTLRGLDFTDSQPDKAVAEYLKKMGSKILIEGDSVTITSSGLKGTDIDMNKTPDALPAMTVTAAFAEGTTRLYNVPQARTKETDRIRCMFEELTKLGAALEELPDGLIIHGGKKLRPAILDSRGDHRIVMALSIAGMALEGTTTIDRAQAMGVTFPTYVELMKSLGANMELTK